MAKSKSTTPQDEPTQDEPTAPRRVSPDGFELDRWGLPLVGPVRLIALDGRVDPEADPEGWAKLPAAAAPADPVLPVAPDAPATDTSAEEA